MTKRSHGLSGMFADRYMIERALGRGASATVYLAHDTRQDREIALKVLDNALASVLGAQRFLQEIRITSRLQHPHILPIHDSGEWNGLLYYVCPFVAGESLRARLDREKQLPIEECVRLTCDVASALAHAHSKGVIHRDVKPENILLSDGHALVADFGIARTMDIHTGERLTSSGLIVGTSQYMSPEQASGEREIDFRSDIYSLGCVLYEMLAGIQPFVGPNVQAVIAQRFTHAPRPVTMFRPAVPEHLLKVLDRALAISPADRFQSMKEFEAALPETPGDGGSQDRRRWGRTARDFMRTGKGKVTAAASVAALLMIIAAAVPARRSIARLLGGAPAVDSSMFVVLPMSDANGKVSPQSQAIAAAVTKNLGEFNVALVSDARIDDVSQGTQPTRSLDALRIAANVGAGNLIWISPDNSSPSASELKLYDVRTNNGISSVSISSVDSVPRVLYGLLKDPSRPSTADGGDGLTRSFAAWRAYGRAHSALKQWDLQRAEKEIEIALRADPDFAPARVWSAQLAEWKRSEELKDRWARDAGMAAANAERLAPRDRHLALALNALGQNDFPAACAEYRKLTELDSMDFIGWHGLGQCESEDQRVISSKTSPSGFAFRSGYSSAALNYLRAIRLEPGAHAITPFDVMMQILPVFVSTGRRGVDSSGAVRFAAWPSMQNDTLSFVPYPIRIWSTMRADRSRYDAFVINAGRLSEFVRSWTRAQPDNADAYEALAAILEVRGDIAARSDGGLSASEAISRAIALAKTDRQKLRAQGTEVRLRIKRGNFAGAEQLADSLLSRYTSDHFEPDLMSAAAFSGRVARLAKEAEANRKWLSLGYTNLQVPPTVIASAAEYFARAALGACGPELESAEANLLSQLESYTTPEQRPAAIHILLARARSLATPCSHGASALKITTPETPLARIQQAYARNDFSTVRRALDSLAQARANMRPGDLSLDFIYQEAWLRAAIGDSAAAIRQLDLALNALPVFNSNSLKDPAAASALGQAMLLRSDLARAKGDRSTAARWGNAVRNLWRHSDPELQVRLQQAPGQLR